MKTLTCFMAPLGALFLTSSALAGGSITINEIRIDNVGSDVDEYVEIAGAPSTSLDGLTYFVIGDGTGGSGVIDNNSVHDLTGSSIPASGFFVMATPTFTLGTADLVVSPIGFENSDNVTHMLVSGFTGAIGDDLDVDDDGVLDLPVPWTTLIDSVALVESKTSGELVYSTNKVGPDGTFVPGHSYKCGTWRVGDFTVGVDDTPGVANNCDPDTFCPGVNGNCPCANGGSGGAGCDLPQATGGVFLTTSSFAPSGGGGTVQFDGTGYRPTGNPASVLIRSTLQTNAVAFGDGLLCLDTGPLLRISTTTASSGSSTHNISHGAGAGTFVYQAWFRSQPFAFCTTDAFNTSNGVVIDW